MALHCGVWHCGLIYKMAKLKIPYYLIKSIHELLTGRTFIVRVGNSKSTIKYIENGLPQGAVPRFINDLTVKNTRGLHQSTHEFTMLFAADIYHLMTYINKDDAETKTKAFLSQLESWMNSW